MAHINKALDVGYSYHLEALNNTPYTTGTEPHYRPPATKKDEIVTSDFRTIISNVEGHTPD
jgi:hypothetical protein